MTNNQSDQIQIWLELLCQMLPGIGQAVLIQKSSVDADPIVRWPSTAATHSDVMTAANLADTQNQVVTTTMSAGESSDSAVDTIIALPLLRSDSLKRTLAVLVRIKPSQQPTVIQILHWGENWLKLVPEVPLSVISETQYLTPQGMLVRARNNLSNYVGNLNNDRLETLLTKLRSSWLVLSVLLITVVLTFATSTYRVTASANLEGKIQRAIVAPFDGYVVAAHARAGKTVSAGEIIAELDTEELLQEQHRYAAEINEYDHEYRKALSIRDQTQAHIFKSRVSQAEAQLNILNKKIQRSSLVSTLDGVIITGDLSRSLGAPVKTGDVLFEVAPLDEYRLIILVDEKQVVDVTEGLQGDLTLKSMPSQTLPFVIHKVSPVFVEDTNGITYRVEARLNEPHTSLRPGMEGVAKIDIEQRRLGWIYFHKLFDLMRLWVWRWLP
jgi:multidrug resistance efflux pump